MRADTSEIIHQELKGDTSIYLTQRPFWNLVPSIQFEEIWGSLWLLPAFMTYWGGTWRGILVQILPGGNCSYFIVTTRSIQAHSELRNSEDLCLASEVQNCYKETSQKICNPDSPPWWTHLPSQIHPGRTQLSSEGAVSCPPLAVLNYESRLPRRQSNIERDGR